MKEIPQVSVVLLNKLSGGIDRMIANLLCGFGEDESKVKINIICRNVELLFLNNEVEKKWNVRRIESKRSGYSVATEIRVIKSIYDSYVNTRSSVILNPHDRVSLAYCSLLRLLFPKRFRLIPTVHQLAAGLPMQGIKIWIFKFIEKVGFALSDRILCVCEARRTELIRNKVKSSLIRVAYNGCILTDVVSPEAKIEAKMALQLKGDTPVVSFVGRLSPEKGILDLVAAISTRPPSRIGYCLLVVGSGPLERDIVKLIPSSNAEIRLCGASNDVGAVYRATDVLVAPSRDEGFSMTILEAMGYGIPVVATRVGGIPEIVDDSVGHLVDPGCMNDLLDYVEDLLKDRATRLRKGAAARQRVHANFTVDHMCRNTIRCFLSEE